MEYDLFMDNNEYYTIVERSAKAKAGVPWTPYLSGIHEKRKALDILNALRFTESRGAWAE